MPGFQEGPLKSGKMAVEAKLKAGNKLLQLE